MNFANSDIATNWKLFKDKSHSTIDNPVPSVVISSSTRALWVIDFLKAKLNKSKRKQWEEQKEKKRNKHKAN